MIKKVLKKILDALNGKYRNTVLYKIPRAFDLFLYHHFGGVYKKTIARWKRAVKTYNVSKSLMQSDEWLSEFERLEENYNPLVSVIVPNYNHAAFLKERLDSVYNQTYKNYEVILLDDCSSDESRAILSEYAQKHEKTRCYFNENNSGCVFKQWSKGIEHANGELIWIAESDDYCESNFLETLVKNFKSSSVMLAFSRSVFVQNSEEIWSIEEYLSDIELDFKKNFTMTANNIVPIAFAKKNIVPNVSSAVFRNVKTFTENFKNAWFSYRLCGDWLFYLDIIRGGCISYTVDTLNYYRVHEESTSKKVQKTQDYYNEFYNISTYVAQNYNVPKEVWECNLKQLQEKKVLDAVEVNVSSIYNIDVLLRQKRNINIVMAVFTLDSGGGETYPLYLANQMRKDGHNVVVLDFGLANYKKEIRDLLDGRVPLIRLKNNDYLYAVLKALGADVIHSHHASVDDIIAKWINSTDLLCKHIITLHGMYEAIDREDSKRTIDEVKNSCAKFIYIADKNLTPFQLENAYDVDKFTKFPNGLPIVPIRQLSRKDYGIDEEDFVLCLVSRAMPEKGWIEAIKATNQANQLQETKKIHLLLIGGGDFENECRKYESDTIHVLGIKNNVRDYFSMSDMGILPTFFKGESFPLVVIESLLCNRPMIVTNIAETPNMLLDEAGEPAGILLEMSNGRVDIDKLTECITKVVSDVNYYETLKSRTTSAAKKFDLHIISNKYVECYYSVL